MTKSHPVDIHVGRRLRLRRTTLGMSQEAIGDATGVSFQQIQKYERGINRIGSSRLFDFSKLLRVPIGYFFEGFGDDIGELGMADTDVAGFKHEALSSRETIDIMRSYARIKSPAMRKKIADLIKAVSEEQTEEA